METTEEFKTGDFALASALSSHGHRLVATSLNHESPGKYYFYFLRTEQLLAKIDLFHQKRLNVEVISYMTSLRYIKVACPSLCRADV